MVAQLKAVVYPSLSLYFLGFQPFKVVQDFFHPQYVSDRCFRQCNNVFDLLQFTTMFFFFGDNKREINTLQRGALSCKLVCKQLVVVVGLYIWFPKMDVPKIDGLLY